jgi:hypothetical protein
VPGGIVTDVSKYYTASIFRVKIISLKSRIFLLENVIRFYSKFYLNVFLLDYAALKCELSTMSTLYRTGSQVFLNSTSIDLFPQFIAIFMRYL